MINLIIQGETPSKKNSRIVLKNGKNIPSKTYQQWHKGAMQQLDIQCQIERPIVSEIEIDLSFYHGDQRRRDSDNGTSSILDLLTDKGILSDDNWKIVRKLQISNFYDKNMARCEICIKPYFKS